MKPEKANFHETSEFKQKQSFVTFLLALLSFQQHCDGNDTLLPTSCEFKRSSAKRASVTAIKHVNKLTALALHSIIEMMSSEHHEAAITKRNCSSLDWMKSNRNDVGRSVEFLLGENELLLWWLDGSTRSTLLLAAQLFRFFMVGRHNMICKWLLNHRKNDSICFLTTNDTAVERRWAEELFLCGDVVQ